MKRPEFRLKKVKVDGKVIVIDYSRIGDEKELTEKNKVVPHPDLKSALNEFAILMTEIFDMPEENHEKFVINGIVISIKGSVEQVMILSTFLVESGSKVAVNSPNISMTTDHWPSQDQLEAMTKKVVDECYEYLFKNKAAQLEVPFDKEDNEPE